MSPQNVSPDKKEEDVHAQSSSVPGTDDGEAEGEGEGEGATAESDPSSDIDECAPAESDPSSNAYEGATAEHDPSSNAYEGATAESDPSCNAYEGATAEHDPSCNAYEGATAESDPSSNVYVGAPAEPDPSCNAYEGAPGGHDPSSNAYEGATAEFNPSPQTTPRVRPASASGQSDEFLPDADQAPHDGADSQDERGQPPSASTVDDPNQPLEAFDWDDLEARFCAKMEECKKVEEEIGEEFRRWVEVSFEKNKKNSI